MPEYIHSLTLFCVCFCIYVNSINVRTLNEKGVNYCVLHAFWGLDFLAKMYNWMIAFNFILWIMLWMKREKKFWNFVWVFSAEIFQSNNSKTDFWASLSKVLNWGTRLNENFQSNSQSLWVVLLNWILAILDEDWLKIG